MMDFAFSDEQLALRDAARELFTEASPPSRLRELWDGGGRDRTLWKQMAEMGMCGLRVPDGYGGLGGTEVDLVLVLEEAGRAALPEPLAETVAIATPWIVETGNEDLRKEWLPAIASGDAVVSVQFSGQPIVAEIEDVDLLMVEKPDGVYALRRGQFGGTLLDGEDRARRVYEAHAFTGVETRATKNLESREAARERATWAAAALLNGVSMRLLEMTVAYVKEREQFGRAVGSFQAVKHKLASAHVLLEGARSACWYAAYALATRDAGRARAVAAARVTANEAHAFANREALQCHGGIGFTWEHDLHLWLKRGNALRALYTSDAAERAALAATVFEEA